MGFGSLWMVALAVVALLAAARIVEAVPVVSVGPLLHDVLSATPEPHVTFCNTTSDLLVVHSLTFRPVGANLTLAVDADLTRPILNGSSVVFTMKVDMLPILDKTIDLCAALRVVGKRAEQCPLHPGHYQAALTHALPPVPVQGVAEVHLRVVEPTGKEVLCVDVHLFTTRTRRESARKLSN